MQSMTSKTPVSSIRNLGPVSSRQFAKAGITSADEIRSLGADRAYQRLLATGVRPHFIGYYALVLGLQERHWTDCPPDEKAMLRKRFEAVVKLPETPDSDSDSNALARARLGAALDELGFVE